MPRLRRADCSGPGIARRRRGRGWIYEDAQGHRITDPELLRRIDALVLPPAWRDVWICPYPNGHVQAIGTDAAGRRQYRYHDDWRRQRDRTKHDSVLEFAQALPAARLALAEHLAQRGLTRQRVLAAAVRLLDFGFFRIGSEEYAEANNTYGLATMRREHVKVSGDVVTFVYIGKHGKQRVQSFVDEPVRTVVSSLKRRRDAGPELLAYRGPAGWADVRSADINNYLREELGLDASAKSFRTWNATVLAAVGLAVVAPAATSPSASKRAVAHVVKEVAGYLGNTPAVCRSSYIDPRVIELYQDGITIADDLEQLGEGGSYGVPAYQGPIEGAVLDLLRDASTRRRVTRLSA
ncbi:MAG: DNA topoisomerase IB [Mycobacteriales bacterium]